MRQSISQPAIWFNNMIIWINGAFGAGKTTTAFELKRRLASSFIYDPENIGYFIRRNSPKSFSRGDFQDFPLWREVNFKLLKMISNQYDGVIIVPMTLVNPEYFKEIVSRLREDGIEIRHFILWAGRETIIKRLRLRMSHLFGGDSFAVNSIERCMHSFDNYITEGRINTENMNIKAVAEEIARRCGLLLRTERSPHFIRTLQRYWNMLKHIK